jgi:signal transduction histidine kinase
VKWRRSIVVRVVMSESVTAPGHLSYRRWLSPPAPDVIAALVAIGVGQAVVWGHLETEKLYGSQLYNAGISVLTLAALAWRRIAPVGALIWFVALFCLLQTVLPHNLPTWTGFFPLVFLTANAGYRAARERSLIGLVSALAGFSILTVVEPTLQSLDHYVFDAAVLVLPWLVARSLAARTTRAQRLSGNLAELERVQAEHQRQAVASERARIARELHDVVAHSVSLLVLQVASARTTLGDRAEDVRATLLAAEGTGREALDELRRMLGLLRQPDLLIQDSPADPGPPQPDLAAIPALIRSFTSTGMEVDLELVGSEDEIGPGMALTVYRTIQEGLTNVLKHAPGARACVTVDIAPSQVTVRIVNTGGDRTVGPGTGNGLIGLRERVALFNGRFQAGPSDLGWTLEVVLPRTPSSHPPRAPR